ncbi:hypothetical protein AAFF_G00033400 [Aldrovandia affinis]|uniref:Uncharacterized protein n=1 Tax=Aldrovandia affinis TaxID=143900 RepID=A0AAD7WG42_9TELE|nr:hypothetical protein AAFF_G00033400 [Aldrovandia affinis]
MTPNSVSLFVDGYFRQRCGAVNGFTMKHLSQLYKQSSTQRLSPNRDVGSAGTWLCQHGHRCVLPLRGPDKITAGGVNKVNGGIACRGVIRW